VPAAWQEGSSFLYDYSRPDETCTPPNADQSASLLIIPSLINRHYILDLEEGNSFVKYLAGKGVATYLASWGEPLENELHFSIDSYVVRIGKMIDRIYNRTGQKVILTGYCMGGLLSLAAANLMPDKIKAIAFLATPWDFHSGDFPRLKIKKKQLTRVQKILGSYKKVPASFIQAMFYYMHAHLIGRKFEIYPLINTQTHFRQDFLAVENWVNDGISMTSAVARECFIGWVNNNNVANLKWKINGRHISPKFISHLPTFFAIPQKDSIVPPSCASPLVDYFQNRTIIKPGAGHVGMVVGTLAKSQTWEPFLAWIRKLKD
jgi:polyhydroxyalkanoate synthase